MKKIAKFLLSLLGNEFIQKILADMVDPIIARFTAWLLKQAYVKFGSTLFYAELSNWLQGLSLEDFFNEQKANLQNDCKDCIKNALK